LPGIALATVVVSWRHLGISHVIASGAVMILLYAFADVARRRGKLLEDGIYRDLGGKPSTAMLRHRDDRFDAGTKARWCGFLAKTLHEAAPSAAAERSDPATTDGFYERGGNWLRERTRQDQKKYKLVFEENITYGFRRNLLGLKWPGLILNVIVLIICLGSLLFRLPISIDDVVSQRLLYVLIIALFHALFFLLVVNQAAVEEAANQYARQLLLACETLATGAPLQRARAKKMP
jgi:hypothetical protein